VKFALTQWLFANSNHFFHLQTVLVSGEYGSRLNATFGMMANFRYWQNLYFRNDINTALSRITDYAKIFIKGSFTRKSDFALSLQQVK